jgi:hypothetical protein
MVARLAWSWAWRARMVWMLLFDSICSLFALGSFKFPMLAKTYVNFVPCIWVGWTVKPALKTKNAADKGIVNRAR